MIKPHGANQLNSLFISDEQQRQDLIEHAKSLPQILVSSATAANAVMLGSGYFTPLNGFMSKADILSVANQMKTEAGVFFPTPVANMLVEVQGISQGQQIALLDPNREGDPVIAIQTVNQIDELTEIELNDVVNKIYGTTDSNHPGVKAFLSQGRYVVSGDIQVLNFSYFEIDFPETFKTADQIRADIEASGWQKVVAFQTRNPMHRAHEELCKMAMQAVDADGCVIHMLLGKLKAGDIPANVRNEAIETMVDHYFEPNSAMISGYGFDMLYAGPREAVLHAVFRQNMGATHFIIGRDHAGVGDYYGAFDAQAIFEEQVPEGVLEIQIFNADHTAYSKKLNEVVMMRDVPDHAAEDFVLLSGTKVREMLGQGIAPPPEFSRPEVAQILMDYYQSL